MAAQQPVLIYDRIDANRRNTLLVLGAFVLIALPAVALMTYLLMIWTIMVIPVFWFGLKEINTQELVVLATIGLGIVLLAAYLQYQYASALVLRKAGARPVTRDQEPDLWRTVENLCIGAGLPQPRVYVVESAAPNAFAVGSDPDRAALVVTRGLLSLLDPLELEGVIARELSHIGNQDTRLKTIMAALMGTLRLPFVIVAETFLSVGLIVVLPVMGFMWMMYHFVASWAGFSWVLFSLGVVYVFLGAPLLGQLLRWAMSEEREFRADAAAALLTRYPEGLARALAKIGAVSSPPMKAGGATAHLYVVDPLSRNAPWWDRMFPAHPPLEERISRLAEMGGIAPSVLRAAEEAGAKFRYTDTHTDVAAREAGLPIGEATPSAQGTQTEEAVAPADPAAGPVIRIETFPEENRPWIAGAISQYTGMYGVDDLLENLPTEFEVAAETLDDLNSQLEQLGCNVPATRGGGISAATSDRSRPKNVNAPVAFAVFFGLPVLIFCILFIVFAITLAYLASTACWMC